MKSLHVCVHWHLRVFIISNHLFELRKYICFTSKERKNSSIILIKHNFLLIYRLNRKSLTYNWLCWHVLVNVFSYKSNQKWIMITGPLYKVFELITITFNQKMYDYWLHMIILQPVIDYGWLQFWLRKPHIR